MAGYDGRIKSDLKQPCVTLYMQKSNCILLMVNKITRLMAQNQNNCTMEKYCTCLCIGGYKCTGRYVACINLLDFSAKTQVSINWQWPMDSISHVVHRQSFTTIF